MDEDQDAEGEDEEEDAEGSNDQDALGNEDSEEDAEGEDDDVDMDDHPPPPVITRHPAPSKGKLQTIVSAPPAGTLKSVEAKEMEDDDDEELSELDSQEDDELEGNDEEDEEEDEEDESDEDDENSRSATPDLSKLTKRQRGQFVESEGTETNELMALSNEALKKKHLTAEEHVQRRAEMARRRKNLSEKRNEEEKVWIAVPVPHTLFNSTDLNLDGHHQQTPTQTSSQASYSCRNGSCARCRSWRDSCCRERCECSGSDICEMGQPKRRQLGLRS